MISYKHLALAILLASSRTALGNELRGSPSDVFNYVQDDTAPSGFATPAEQSVPKSAAEERLGALAEMTTTFAAAKKMIEENSASLDGDRLNLLASKFLEFKGAFQQMESEMVSEGADNDVWEKFGVAQKAYEEVLESVVAAKERQSLDEIDSFVEVEEEESANDAAPVETPVREETPSRMDESIETLHMLNKSFDDIEFFVDNAEITPENVDKLKTLSLKVMSMEDFFPQLKDNLMEDDAGTTEWDAYGETVEHFGNMVSGLVAKLESAAAVANAEAEEQEVEDAPTFEDVREEPAAPEETTKTEEVEQHDDSDLEPLYDMLIDVKESILTGSPSEGLSAELDYINSQLEEMKPSAAVSKMNEVVALLHQALEQKKTEALEAEELEEEEEEKESFEAENEENVELASAMSKLGFPQAKIDQVQEILVDEEEAYEVNQEEKNDIAKDETDY